MTKQEIIDNLSSQANPTRLKRLTKLGYEGDALGVNLGPIRKLAKTIGINHSLGMELWNTHILEAQLLACMILNPQDITSKQAQAMISETSFTELLDDLMFRCLTSIQDLAELETTLNKHDTGLNHRAYWCIQIHKVHTHKQSHETIDSLLERASQELSQVKEATQWMMNRFVAEVGIHYPDYRERCLMIGESCGVYKDMKVSKGCTSAYIPSWIHAVVKDSPWK